MTMSTSLALQLTTSVAGSSVNNNNRNPNGLPTTGTPELAEYQYWQDDFAPLQSAGKAILQVLRQDEASPHGDLYRRILSTSTSTSTGSETTDSPPNHHYFADGQWTHTRSVPLPSFLQDQLSKAKISILMGLFSQANMAWMTIDDTIYLWSHVVPGSTTSATDREFLYFKVPSSQPIISAGLVRPKPGVFTQAVEWCLVLTTKEEAMLCALARKNHHALAAVLTNFVIPSDWVSFLSVASTQSGRVFLGGQDGHLYELDYDLLVEANGKDAPQNSYSQLEDFYDGNPALCPAQITHSQTQGTSTTALAKGKRVMNALFNYSNQPPRKCRKLDHSQSTFSSFVPETITNFTSALLGESTTTGGGPIIQMAVDEERQVLYTLSTRGWICVLDIAEDPKVSLAAVLDTPVTARLYLEAVSRGRMYPPSTSNPREGNLAFPGGGEAAQAGVGGMEGARNILKVTEQATTGTNKRQRPATSLLAPVSIQVVPVRESTRITLVAITAGGMRYYLSCLNPNTLGTGPAPQPFGTPRHRQSIKPHSKITLCHIRSPPSLAVTDMANISHPPTRPTEYTVDAACYKLGVFFAAFHGSNPAGAEKHSSGDIVVAATVDTKARAIQGITTSSGSVTSTYLTPGGICESVSFPLSSKGQAIATKDTLPGGRVWDICATNNTNCKLMNLVLRSKTPTDTELGFTIAPAYNPPRQRQSKIETSNTSDLVPTISSHATSTVSSLAFAVVTNLLLARPARYGIDVQRPNLPTQEESPLYRISKRSGADGFSLSAADAKASTGIGSTRSARLSPWLLTPQIVPLSPLVLEYYDHPPPAFLAVNAGGLHEFRSSSIMEQLASTILSAGSNARSDQRVTKFFESFGYSEGCAMCLILAMRPSSSSDLKAFALRAALSRAYRPALVPLATSDRGSDKDPWVPDGYSFTSSALYDGLTLAVARLLRPFWYKPAVVVTEGRVLKREFKTITTPAKVELLFDDEVLDAIRSPLASMQHVISRVFSKAVEYVPLSKSGVESTDLMETDDDNFFLTRAIDYQRKGQAHLSSSIMRASEADELAQHIEERNIHSLYRLVSRTAQLLSLLSHLHRAHSMSDLPEVEWGQLHGISIAQLVLSREGQDRLETTLNSLVTSLPVSNLPPSVSADAKQLAEVLSQQCYHFFSPGFRYAYFGFQAAQDALATAKDQRSRSKALTQDAVESFKMAAKQWFSPSLVTGRLVHNQESESYDKISENALHGDSLLAKACTFLIALGEVAALVEICLLTASNFEYRERQEMYVGPSNYGANTYRWEKGLYHRRQGVPSSMTSVITPHVTNQDAVKTCFALIFHHLSTLLDAPMDKPAYQLGEKMVSVCAASQDEVFLTKLFSHLIESNHTDVLLRIKSPVLESWLEKAREDNLDRLLRYYQIQSMHVEAGEVAASHANRMDRNVDLHERIECLVYAVDAFSRSQSIGHADPSVVQLKLKQCEERLKIARLQGRIFQTISSTKYELSPEDISSLRYRLLSANELLNRYAIPYEMYEFCLLLLHACKHKDIVHIEHFWKSLLCKEVFPCCTRNEQAYRLLLSFTEGTLSENSKINFLDDETKAFCPVFEEGIWMKSIEGTVVRLGSEIYGADESFAFPVEFVMSCLEELRHAYSCATGGFDERRTLIWSFNVLVSAGVEKLAAMRAYEQMIEKGYLSTLDVDPRRRLQQIRPLISMLEAFDSSANVRDPANDGDELFNACASGAIYLRIEDYRSKLQSLPIDVSGEERRLTSLERNLHQRYG